MLIDRAITWFESQIPVLFVASLMAVATMIALVCARTPGTSRDRV